jgi:hypothetical protein
MVPTRTGHTARIDTMEIDNPEVRREVETAFSAYESALVSNDVAVLDALFRTDARTIRYGASENLYGHAAIAAFRAARPSGDLPRSLERTVITTYGHDFATACTLFRRDTAPGRVGRQTQSWVRFADGWKVVAAHVSLIPEPTT